MPDLAIALRDGAILAAAGSALIMGALRYNPRLFMRHFPQALKDRIPPLSAHERRVGAVVGVALLGLLVGGPVASAWKAREGASFPDLALHAFVVGMVFNLVDWLVLDELWIGMLRPRWALPPGATEADFHPFDHARHARGFATGTVLCATVAVIAGAGALWLG